MASVFDSIRTIVATKHAMFKILVLSAALAYPLYQIAIVKFDGWLSLWPILSIFLLIYCLGFIIRTIHNEISDSTILISGVINPLYIPLGIGLLLFLAPMAAGMGYSGYYLYQLGLEKDLPNAMVITIVAIDEIIFFILLEIQIMLYSHKLNPFRALNIVELFKNFSDFFYKTILLVLVMTAISVVTFAFGILVTKMFGLTSFAFFYFIVFVIFFYLLIILYYLGQVYMEISMTGSNVDYYDDDTEKIIDKDKMV